MLRLRIENGPVRFGHETKKVERCTPEMHFNNPKEVRTVFARRDAIDHPRRFPVSCLLVFRVQLTWRYTYRHHDT